MLRLFCKACFIFSFKQGYSKTRDLDSEELLEHLPALQQLLHRLVGCRVKLCIYYYLYVDQFISICFNDFYNSAFF